MKLKLHTSLSPLSSLSAQTALQSIMYKNTNTSTSPPSSSSELCMSHSCIGNKTSTRSHSALKTFLRGQKGSIHQECMGSEETPSLSFILRQKAMAESEAKPECSVKRSPQAETQIAFLFSSPQLWDDWSHISNAGHRRGRSLPLRRLFLVERQTSAACSPHRRSSRRRREGRCFINLLPIHRN